MLKKVLVFSAVALAAGVITLSMPQTAFAASSSAQADSVIRAEQTTDSQVLRYTKTLYGIFGTDATIALYDKFDTEQSQNDAIAFVEDVYTTLTQLEGKLSASVEGSDIYNFNAAAPGSKVQISSDTYNVLQYALSVNAETDGAYNAGVYYSVDLYGFATRSDDAKRPYDRDNATEQLPEDKYVTAFKELAESFSQIELLSEGDACYAVKPQKTVKVEGDSTEYNLHVDLGGIGKGYAGDIIDAMLEEAGYLNSYFSFGSSTMAINGSATSEDGKWELTFRDPRGNITESYLTTRVANSSVSTSGDYEKFYEIGGKRYCHIIDPSTGSPINNGILTASVIGGTAAEADARTTAICCMSKDEALAYINSEEVKALGLKMTFVHQNAFGWKTVYTNMAEGEYTVSLNNSLYTWVYLIIVIAVIALIVAVYITVKVVKNKRARKRSQGERQ